MNYVKIGEKIRKYRKAVGMSQEELAEKIGISVTHMSHIETANTKLSLPVFVCIAEVLGIQTDDLLNDEHSGSKKAAESEMLNLLSSCTDREAKMILDIAKASKSTFDKYLN